MTNAGNGLMLIRCDDEAVAAAASTEPPAAQATRRSNTHAMIPGIMGTRFIMYHGRAPLLLHRHRR